MKKIIVIVVLAGILGNTILNFAQARVSGALQKTSAAIEAATR